MQLWRHLMNVLSVIFPKGIGNGVHLTTTWEFGLFFLIHAYMLDQNYEMRTCNMLLYHFLVTLQWRHNGRDGVSSHQRLYCLLSSCFRYSQRKHQSSASLAFEPGIHRSTVNSPHKRPVTRKMVPFHDVIMKCHLAAVAGTTILIPQHPYKSLQLNWSLGTARAVILRENHHASVVWTWYHWVAIAYLYQPSP